MASLQIRGSNWGSRTVEKLDINNVMCRPLKGSSYIPFPRVLAEKKATISMKNEDKECLKCLEDGRQMDVIYTNFEKALDKVPDKRLLSKLQSYGASQELINWIKAFLSLNSFRRQQVRVNCNYSLCHPVISGISQSRQDIFQMNCSLFWKTGLVIVTPASNGTM